MQTLKSFNEYFNNFKEDGLTSKMIESYITGEITYEQFVLDFNQNLNESAGDFINNMIKKVMTIFKKIKEYLFSNIKKYGKKILNLIVFCFNNLGKFFSKNRKVFIYITIFLIFMLVISTAVYANTTGDLTSATHVLDAALGFLTKHADELSYTLADIEHAKVLLIQMRDGLITGFDDPSIKQKFNSDAYSIAKSIVNHVSTETTFEEFFNYWKVGKDLVLEVWKEFANGDFTITIK